MDGVWGAGETVAEAKQSVLDSIWILKAYNTGENIPNALKGKYELVYKFDTASFLNYYKV